MIQAVRHLPKSMVWLAAAFVLVWAGLRIARLFTVSGSTVLFMWRANPGALSPPAMSPTTPPASRLHVQTYVLSRRKVLGAEYVVTQWNLTTPQGVRPELRKALSIPL